MHTRCRDTIKTKHITLLCFDLVVRSHVLVELDVEVTHYHFAMW